MAEREDPDGGGLRTAVTRVVGSTLGLLRTRLELAGVELAEERERLETRVGLLFAGILLLLFGVMGLGAFVVVYFWDTHRLTAILTVSAVCLLAGVLLLLRAKAMGNAAPSPFAATIAEFEKDRAWLTASRQVTVQERSIEP